MPSYLLKLYSHLRDVMGLAYLNTGISFFLVGENKGREFYLRRKAKEKLPIKPFTIHVGVLS